MRGASWRARGPALAVAFAILSLAPVAAADPPLKLAQALHGDARARYDAGRALYRDGDYAGALAEFERAHALAPDPRLLWNMAACERKLRHYAKVLRLVDGYLAAPLLTEEDRREATQFASAVRALVGAATVTTQPDGVTVLVDDEPVGTTPLAGPVLVDPGMRRIRFVKSGFKESTQTVEILPNSSTTWSATLEAEPPPAEPLAAAPEVAPAPIVASRGPAVEAKPAPSHAPGASRSTPAVLFAAGGGALAVTGVVLVGLSAGAFGRLERECGHGCAPSRWRSWQAIETTGDLLLAAGGAAIAFGVVWWFALPRGGGAVGWVSPAPGGLATGARF